MMKFDKYPLCAPNNEDTSGDTQIPKEKKRPISKQETVKIVDDDDIDAVDGKENNKNDNSQSRKDNSVDPQEPTRGKMASVFISGFFMIIMICFIYAAWIQASLSEVKDMVIAIIGALSGLVGFVIGYYFKTTAKS